MKIALLVSVALIISATVAYFAFFPDDTIIGFRRPGGGEITFSRGGVSLRAAPDFHAKNGFDHIEPYVSRLLVPASHLKFLHIFTPDGKRGFGFSARGGTAEATLTVDWRQKAEKEAAIRAFFSSRGIAPTRDYLAGNGGIPDATRILQYPIAGSTVEVAALTKRILQELCGVTQTEALSIGYGDL